MYHLLERPPDHRDRPALNLAPCFTPVESPESSGMAEAFVKTFQRDYVRGSPIPHAVAALTLIDNWMEDYNTVQRIPDWAIARLGSTSFPNPSRVRFDGVKPTGSVSLRRGPPFRGGRG